MIAKPSTTRFSDRVEDYIKYRPPYPESLIDVLKKAVNLRQETVIADIGSGTGISSILFLKNKNKVLGVEPNKEMREAAEQLLHDHPNFISVNGAAEQTTLSNKSIDLIFCGQAFHWFDKEKSKKEFKRILREDGHIVLAWNERSTKSPFQREYENALLEYIDEYKFVNHRNISEDEIANFFAPKQLHTITLSNQQRLNLQGLKGRLLSSSYCPKSGMVHNKLMNAMERIFRKYEQNGFILFEYETKMYWC
jgi:SAM-dependent methyltransferase